MRRYRIAVIPGDGIGPEVISQGIRVLEAMAAMSGDFQLEWEHFPWGSDFYARSGQMMPSNGLEQLRTFDAIYFGAVGDKSVPDHVSVWELILPIRRKFQQYINLRPAKRLPGVPSPLVSNSDVDFTIVRENTEGEYSNIGGHLHEGTQEELVIQTSVFTRIGVARVARYAFDMARRGKLPLAVATKSNAMNYSMTFWDEVIREVSAEYPDVRVEIYHVDALATYFVSRPHTLGVVLASNLFGDILSDLGAAVVGGLGVAPSANLNPERRFPSMFEPVHGSAPDIAGKGIANPIAAVWSGAMMLDFIGEQAAGRHLMEAIQSVLATPEGRTVDLGGEASTEGVGDALIEELKQIVPVGRVAD